MIGILLVNLGTPSSYEPRDVHRYLVEFLTDPRVIDTPWLTRQLLVRGVIVPRRYKQSAKAYREIWMKEGSPLMVNSLLVKQKLQKLMGDQFAIEMAMRYQNPSIQEGLKTLMEKGVDHLIVLPLFPQYASATTGSIQQKVMELLSQYPTIPKLTMVNQFATHPLYIDAVCETASKYPLKEYDHILFSFHGLPKRQLTKIDRQGHCMKKKDCCATPCGANKDCYSAQCFGTMQAVAKQLGIVPERYSICFQSRLGKEPWLEPFTSDRLKELVTNGNKRVLVFCLSFVSDCLETIYEIGEEYNLEFKHLGGERLDYVESLNDHPKWIEAIEKIVLKA